MRKITLLLFAFISSFLGYSQLALEGFEGPTFPPTNWATFDTNVGGTLNWGTNTNSYQGVLAAYMNRQNIGAGVTSEEYLATPSVFVQPNSEIRFFSRTFTAGNAGTLYQVKIKPVTAGPQNDPNGYILLQEYTEDQLSAVFNVYEEKIINVPIAYEGLNVYIAFVMKNFQPTGSLSGDRWLLDNVQMNEKCLDPTAGTATPLATSATLSWSGLGATFEIENILATATPTGVATATSSSTNFNQTGLTPNTNYCFYVRAVCSSSSSAWAGPFCYTTSTLPPGCGGNFVDPGGSTANYANNITAANGTTTICPENAGDLVTVTFTNFATEAGFDQLRIYDGNAAIAANLLGTYSGNALPPAFTSSAANGCLTFVFTSDSSVTAAGWIANVTCTPPPSCPRPTAVVAVTPATSNSVEVGWTNVGPATSWEIIALPCGSTPPTATSTGTVVSTNPYNLTGLSSGTCYDIYVRGICSSTDISNWSFTALSVTTQVAPPICGGNFVDPAGISANYANSTDSTVTICPTNPGEQVTVTFTAFDTETNWDGLLVYEGDSTNPLTSPQIASANGTGFGFFANVTGAFWGTALPGPFTSSNPNGCLTFRFVSDGSVNRPGWSANITCGPQPACLQPIGLLTTLPTSNSVTLNWISNGTLFNIEYGPVGFTPGTGTVITGVADSPYVLTGLNSSTQYSFYVQNDCGSVNGQSAWAGPSTFTTQPDYCAGDNFYDLGGENGNYPNNANSTTTICAVNPGDQVTVVFNTFNVSAGDSLSIYDGNAANAANLLGTFDGTTIPSSMTSTLGCLTFVFVSNGFTNSLGWDASIICSPPPTCAKPIELNVLEVTTTSALLDWNQPLNPDGSLATAWEILVVPTGSQAPIGDQPNSITANIHPFLVTGLQSGTEYTFYVRAICSSTDASFWSTGFNFSTLIINDNCDGAVFVPVNSDAYCTLTVNGTISGATPSNVPIGTCTGTADDDVWFQFIATNSYLNISLQSITGSTTDLNHAVYSGDCNGLTLLYCGPNNSSTANGLIEGQTYYIRVYSNSAIPETADFTLCISTPSTCENSSTVCNVSYANTTGVTSLGTIGCLGSSPNPTFFTIQIAQSGPINYLLTQSSTPGGTPNLDVDYAAWGPYNSQEEVCNAIGDPPSNPLTGLTTGCSFSAAPIENFNIANAVQGQFYVILITNFSGQPGYISLTQTNAGQTGSGVTSCCSDPDFNYQSYSFCKDGGSNPVVTLGANSEAGTFSSSPATGLVFVSTSTGEIDLAASTPGNYIITNTLASTETCSVREFTYTIQITDPQTATLSYNQTVFCDTVSTLENPILSGTTGGSYSSSPSGLFINANTGVINPSLSNPGLYNVIYTIAAAGGCPNFTTQPVQVEIIATPNIPQISNVDACNSYTLPQLTVGNYYTETGGNGVQLNAGDTIVSSQTVYVYAANGNCSDEESFTITITQTPQVDVLPNISQCSNYILPTLTVGNYFTGTGGTGTQLNAGDTISSSQTIYIYAQGSNQACFSESSFTVSLGTLEVVPPASSSNCDSYTLPVLSIGNYFTGIGGTGTQLNAGDVITSTQLIYVYAVDGNCIDEDSFTVTINTTPQADDLADVSQCGNYILPTLTTGNYFTGTGGTGTPLNAGDAISTSQTIYVYAQSSTTPNCFTETSFNVTIGSLVVTAPLSGSYCDSYTLPALTLGNYFTGQGGTGTQLNAGDVITSTQLIYVYAMDGVCTDEDSFTVTINSAVADNPNDVFACDSYTLPALSNGNAYYTGPNGTGTLLPDGTVITTTQTIYVFAQSGTVPNCIAENDFVVTIYNTPVPDNPTDVVACDSYTLPSLTVGNYYTQSGGTGTQLAAGTVITSTQTVYVYAQSGSNPICPAENSFVITINSITAQTMSNVTSCDSYTLPTLNANNAYYTGSGGTGTQLTAGSVITSSQTIYIYAQTGTTPNCFAESSFTVTIVPRPVVAPVSSVTSCDSYILPALSVGNYYTQANGGGTQLAVGTSITSSQTIYVYAQSALTGCDAQTSFEVTISQSPVFTIDGDCIGPVFTLFVATGTIPANAEYQWYNGTTPLGTESTQVISGAGSYSCVISVPNGVGQCSTESFYQAVDVLCIIPKGISPNGDGDNDTFNLTGFNVTKLNIFNRYGTIVYSKGNYVNEWAGQSDNGNELPDGTYYYVIERNNAETKSGWVYINRNAN